MGKATITGGGEDGLYTIEVDLGEAQKTARINALNAAIVQIDLKIPAAEITLADAQAVAAAAVVALNAAIDAYVLATMESDDPNDWADELAAHEAALIPALKSAAAASLAEDKVNELKLDKAALAKRLAVTNAIETSIVRAAWCVDLTEDGAGVVATSEINGETGLILIEAGCRPPVAGDGAAMITDLMTPEQAYWNYAALPGWQKWMPTYRTGWITAIDYETDTADVTLDAAASTAQGLGINLQDELPAAPVQYMTCNASAFEVGDHVVVRFDGQLWSAPRTVIGFVDNPKPCWKYLVSKYAFFAFKSVGPSDSPYAPYAGQTWAELSYAVLPRDDSIDASILSVASNVVRYRINKGAWTPTFRFQTTVGLPLLCWWGSSDPPAAEPGFNAPPNTVLVRTPVESDVGSAVQIQVGNYSGGLAENDIVEVEIKNVLGEIIFNAAVRFFDPENDDVNFSQPDTARTITYYGTVINGQATVNPLAPLDTVRIKQSDQNVLNDGNRVALLEYEFGD